MKRLFFLTAAVVVFLCACGQKEEDLGDSYIFGQDNQYYFNNQEALAESEDSYYLFGGGYLFSKSKETGEATILCDKPDCLHDRETDMTRQEDCNAYYGNGSLVYYYNNKLYVIATSIDVKDNYNVCSVVYEMDTTGSTREKIIEAKEQMLCAMVHRGYIYLSFSDFLEDPEVYETNEEKRENSGYRVDRYNLNGRTKKAETIFEKTGEFGQINKMNAYGNKIHLSVSAAENSIDLIYDIQTKTAEEFHENFIGDLTFFRNYFMYHKKPEDEGQTAFETIEAHREEKAILSDAKGNPIDTMSVPISYTRFSNDDLIVNDNQHEVIFDYCKPDERAIQIYDGDGSFIREIKLENGRLPALGMNNDYFFYLKEAENQDTASGYEIWAIDLHRLDDENLKGECFFSYNSPVDAPMGVVY